MARAGQRENEWTFRDLKRIGIVLLEPGRFSGNSSDSVLTTPALRTRARNRPADAGADVRIYPLRPAPGPAHGDIENKMERVIERPVPFIGLRIGQAFVPKRKNNACH